MNPGWAEWKNDEYIQFQSWSILLNKCWDINIKKRWCWNQNCECGFKKLIKESTEIYTFECRHVCAPCAVIRDDGSEPWSRRFNLQAEIDQRISGWMGCHIRQRDRWHRERKMGFHTANEDLPNLNQEYCASLNAAGQAERKMWLWCVVILFICFAIYLWISLLSGTMLS